jgi:septum formation protein
MSAPLTPRLPLVLASASPRRRELLEQLGIPLVVDPVDAEPPPTDGEAPLDYVQRATLAKADAALARARGRQDHRAHLCADTIVIVDDDILGKPHGRQEAGRMLARLAGRTHRVASAFSLTLPELPPDPPEVVITEVVFRPLRPSEIEGYLDSGEWEGKAGAYAIQGLAAGFVQAVHGSYPSVVGLPVCEVLERLIELGVLDGFPIPVRR